MERKSFHHCGTIFPLGWNNIFSMEERFTIGIFSLNHRQAEREMWRMQRESKNRSEQKRLFFPSKTSRHPFSFCYFCIL